MKLLAHMSFARSHYEHKEGKEQIKGIWEYRRQGARKRL